VGRIANGLPPSSTLFRWTSVGRLEDGTVVPSGTDYRIGVRSMDTSVDDRGDRNLALVLALAAVQPVSRVATRPTTVRVTLPNDRRLIRIGRETEIRWESENARPDQRVMVSLVRYPAGCHNAAGAEVRGLGGITLSTGRMIWYALEPLRACDNCAIRLTPERPGDFASDESDDCFVLRPTTTVRVLAPNGGERFRRGAPINLSWDVVNPLSDQRAVVSLTYGAPGCRTVRRRVAELPVETRGLTWPGDSSLAAGQYGFYLSIVTGPRTSVTMEAQDQTDGCFALY
jgi:hypothetical protein